MEGGGSPKEIQSQGRYGSGICLPSIPKTPNGVGDALNIFLLSNHSPLEGLEAALLTRKWDAILGGGTLTSFTDTSLLMGMQKVAPIAGWDETPFQLEAWAVFCTVFLRGPTGQL